MKFHIKHETIMKFAFYFLMFGFMGWVFETTAVFLDTKHWTNRGFLFVQTFQEKPLNYINIPFLKNISIIWGLPFIDMYAYGALIIIVTLSKYKDKLFQMFIRGCIYLTVFELIGSYFCQYIIGRSYWSYFNEAWNFQGRICLQSSLAWGILSIFVISFMKPRLDKIFERIKKWKYLKTVFIILIIYIVICGFVKYAIFPNITAH